MRTKGRCWAAGLVAGVIATVASPQYAAAQSSDGAIPPLVERDQTWDTISTASMLIGAASVSLMPRIYYSSPDATVGWKARWHISALAPIMTFTSVTLLVDGPVKNAIQSNRPGCTTDFTLARLPGSECESFGGPSTHAFAAWGSFGYGTAVFLVDTLKYSDSEVSVGSLVGNVALPFSTAILSSVARAQAGSGAEGHESAGQIVAGTLPGVAVGALLGLGYAWLQEPDCGYGGYIFCW
ncbi:MAG: hypothetical protein AAGA56_25620 [Myxococcota bacterium]